MELEHSTSRANEELKDLKIKVDYKTDQLNEWKHKYEVNFYIVNNFIVLIFSS